MAPDGVVEVVDVAADGSGRLGTALEDGAPDEFGLQRLEEGLDHRVVVAISLARHRDADAVPPQFGLVLDRAVLAASIRVVNEPGGGTSDSDSKAQGRQGQFLVQAVTGGPADGASGEKVDHDGKEAGNVLPLKKGA